MDSMNDTRQAAIDQTKLGGEPMNAIALAIVYVGDCLREQSAEASAVADALNTIATETGSISVALGHADVKVNT